MNKVSILYNNIKNNIPFCFIKMNDGEIGAIDNPDNTTIVSRGDQQSSLLLSEKLKEALNYDSLNYYIGLACPDCNSVSVNIANKYIDLSIIKNTTILNANILINENVNATIEVLSNNLSDKYVVIITNNRLIQNIEKLTLLNIPFSKIIEVSEKNAFDNDYDKIKDLWKEIPNNAYIICLCGPLGRVICYEWYKLNPTFTCLELGSLFDPLLKNRSYSYHQNTLPPCICFSNKLEYLPFHNIVDYMSLEMQNEIFYFYSISDYLNFYKNDIQSVKDVLQFRFKNNIVDIQYINWLEELNNLPTDEQKLLQEYKLLNKPQMYTKINELYNTKSIKELKILCDLYIDYFGHFDENEVRIVKFNQGFANYNIDKNQAIINFEQLLKDKNLEEYIKDYTKMNLINLYPKNISTIPKIIHLIYFKGIDFQIYHLHCVKSMIKYMPTYKINIYISIEPENNPYWDEIKQYSQIELIQRKVPEYFDGFKLSYFQYKADVVRLELLYEYGGIYLDLDMLIIKNFEHIFESNKDFYISKEGDSEDSGLINSFLACKPKNEFIKIWLNNFKSGLRMNNWAYHIRDTNKWLITQNPHFKLKYNIEILENIHFFPIPWTTPEAFVNLNSYPFNQYTYGVHLFETILHHTLLQNAQNLVIY